MIELEKTGRLGEWVQSNQEWLNTRYGKENVVSLALHMDELTPHLHAVIVPLTVQGRLSAKLILGQKVQMREMQTDYARAMKPFGLERGKEGSRAHHEDVKEYYKRLKEDLPKVTEEVEVKKEEVKELKQEIPRLNVVINKQEEELEKLKKAESKLKIKLAEIRANLAGFTLLKGFKYITEGIHALWTRKAKFEALNRENSTLNQKYDETYNELVKVAQASKMVIGDLQQGNVKLLNKNQQLERENKDLKQAISNVVDKITNDMIKKGFSNMRLF
jgi:chromosome segregation ATPase